MSATLGGYIKDLRLQKNISQIEVAFALGWKEPSRLSRIEQGKVKNPPRELLNKLMEALHLTEEEKNQLLVIGNYLPTKEEVKEARKKIGPIVEAWPCNAYAMDYTWRVVYVNKKMYRLLGVPENQQKEVEMNLPNAIEVAFDPNLTLNKTKTSKEWEERGKFLLSMLVRFLYDQRARSREHWYQDLIRRMMDNKLFHKIWPLAQERANANCNFTNFGEKILYSTEKGKKLRLNLHFFVVPVFRDPRFFAEFYVPSDLKTFEYFEKRR